MDYPVADLELSRRLERAEGAAGLRWVEARARVSPEVGAEALVLAGVQAGFDGVDSPITQTFGLGIAQPITEDELATIEAFFASRGAATHHEVSPLVDEATLKLLTGRGYRPIELTNVLYRPIAEGQLPPRLEAAPPSRILAPGEEAKWARVSADGWRDVSPELYDFMLDIGRINAERRQTVCFFAERDATPIAIGVLCMHERVATLAGACTLPEYRRQGAQSSLLAARLEHAVRAGCDLAMVCARPGSASQRNAERQGFRIAYTRTKWRLDATRREVDRER